VSRYLVLNAGSSTLKASLVEPSTGKALRASVDWAADSARAAERAGFLARLLDELDVGSSALAGVGHRFVHGGLRFQQPIELDVAVLDDLAGLSHLAPLHNPAAVETARAALELLPRLIHVAAFDTAFHASLPEEAFIYPLPWHWYADWGMRRFGFHGLSVEWAVGRAAELLGRPAEDLGLVVAHLGSGCSVTAVAGGQSVATSMGYTPLEGLMMGSRAGSVDPGLLLAVLRDGRATLDELAEQLAHRSGLAGISGISGDVREILAAAERGEDRPALALDLFVRRTAEGIGAAAVALDRLDALVFTGGIGEHAGSLRARVVRRLATLGITEIGDQETGSDRLLSEPAARPAVLRVEAREDLVIARALAQMT
jgi:acetate kinase